MARFFSTKIDELLAFLQVDAQLLESTSTVQKVSGIADAFMREIYFDTAKNIEARTPLMDVDALIAELLQGNGANCIEQSFLFKAILNHLGVSATIVHADVYDYDQNAIKSAFISIVHVPLATGFMHIDTVRGFYFTCDGGAVTSNLSLRFEYAPMDRGYTVAKYRGDRLYWKELVLFDLPEQFRKNRLLGMIGEHVDVTPYGVLAPFFSKSNPWRAIFYDLPTRTIKLVNDENTRFIDLLGLDDTDEAGWLTEDMKERVFGAVNHIEERDLDHFELINSSKQLFNKIEEND